MLEFKIKKDELLKGMTQTQSIAEKRSSMPILSNVLLEIQDGRLAITATDLEISFRGTYEAEIRNEGRLTVPARKFYEILRVLGDDESKYRRDRKLQSVGSRDGVPITIYTACHPKIFLPCLKWMKWVTLNWMPKCCWTWLKRPSFPLPWKRPDTIWLVYTGKRWKWSRVTGC